MYLGNIFFQRSDGVDGRSPSHIYINKIMFVCVSVCLSVCLIPNSSQGNAPIWTYYIPIEAQFIWEGLLCKKKSARSSVRTLLSGNRTLVEENRPKMT